MFCLFVMNWICTTFSFAVMGHLTLYSLCSAMVIKEKYLCCQFRDSLASLRTTGESFESTLLPLVRTSSVMTDGYPHLVIHFGTLLGKKTEWNLIHCIKRSTSTETAPYAKRNFPCKLWSKWRLWMWLKRKKKRKK